MNIFRALLLLAVIPLSACETTPKYAYVKEGASAYKTRSDLSKCEYNIRLQKTIPQQQKSLERLCMEGEGYRYKKIN